MKEFARKSKKGNRIIAFMLAVLLVVTTVLTDIPGRVFADAEVVTDETISVQINGKDVSQVTSISPSDPIKIAFSISLEDGEIDNPFSYTVALTPQENVTIPDSTNPYDLIDSVTNDKVGTAVVKDNQITVEITNDNFLTARTSRKATGTIEGTVSGDKTSHKSGDKVNIKVAGKTFGPFTWDNGEKESSLSVSKSANGVATLADGKWTQEFSVTITANDGECTIDSIQDTMGSYLKLDGKYSVTTSGSVKVSSSISDISDLNGTVMSAGDKITLTYKTVVDSAAASSAAGDKVKNTVKGTYTNNKQVSGKTFETSASASLTVPTITKSCVSGSTDDEQTWTVTIDLGTFAKAGGTLADYLGTSGTIVDTPKTGLVFAEGYSGSLKASDFDDKGNGVYTYTYKTTLTDEYKSMESTTVSNTVEVTTTDYGKISTTGTYTTQGQSGAAIKKSATTYDSESGTIGWAVTLSNVSASATKVYVTDTTGNTYNFGKEGTSTYGVSKTGKTMNDNSHTLAKTVKVNGVTVIDNGVITSAGQSVVSTQNQWGGSVSYSSGVGSLYFLDSFISSNGGADITVEYETVINDLSASRVNVLYYNEATLGYHVSAGDKTVLDNNVFEDKDAKDPEVDKDNITKTSKVNDDQSIDYTVKVKLSSIDTSVNKSIVVKDTIPDGLTIDLSSIKVTDYVLSYGSGKKFDDSSVNNIYYKGGTYDWGSGEYCLADRKSSIGIAVNGNNAEFTVSNTWSDVMKLVNVATWLTDPYLEITYTADVTDKNAYNKAGETKSFTNSAQGFYDGNAIGDPVSVTDKITPASMVDKSGAYDSAVELTFGGTTKKYPGVNYVVDVNESAVKLLDGNSRLIGVDTLGAGSVMSYYLDSIKVYNMSGGSESLMSYGTGANQYTYTYDAGTNSLTFSLPDATHIRIEYTAVANVDRTTDTKFTASNSFVLSGLGGSNKSDSDTISASVSKSDYTAESALGAIYIKKYWTSETGIVAVTGSKFKVYKPDQTTLKYTDADQINADKEYTITNTDGTICIEGLEYNTIYALVEVAGGNDVSKDKVPMAVDTNPYYFILEKSGYTGKLPAGVRTFSTAGILEFENQKSEEDTGSLVIKKTIKGELTDAEINDAAIKFEVTDPSGATNEYAIADKFVKGSDGVYTLTLENVAVGSYTIKETATDVTGKSYTVSYSVDGAASKSGKDATATVAKDKTTTVAYENSYTTDSYTVEISKVDAANSEELSGAELTVKDSDGNTVETWTSNTESHKISLTAGKYTLTEDTAPLGYEKASTISFEVGTDGKIVGQTDNKITMVDELTKYEVEISKVDAANSEELAGATLTIADSNKTIVATWVSSASETHKVKLAAGTYTLIESITPDGYATAESITFTVGKDGKVKSDATGAVTGTKVTMKDQPKQGQIVITKTIEGDVTKEEAEGALRFEIKTSDDGVLGTYTLEDFTYSDATKTWTKTIDCAAGSYTVEETVTDITGYILKSVTYTVDENSTTGSKADVTVANGGKKTVDFNDSYDVATNEVVISKVDAANSEELPGAELTVKDSDGNIVETWTSGTESHKVSLAAGKYTLTENTAPLGYEKASTISFEVGTDGKIVGQTDNKVTMVDELTKHEVEISKEDAANGNELSGAVLKITDESGKEVTSWTSTTTAHKVTLTAGKYTLTETTAPDGYAFAESIEFTVDKEGNVTSDVTGAVTGTKVTMKDQPKEAEIVITKTIEGDVTKEEAEGSLKFTVKKADGTEVGTYTLKDFDYDSSTGVWTKTLPCASGSYTVEETVTDITGYTLKSVTYTVDGTSTTGSTADVTVANGGKKTVDFNDSYDVATNEVVISKVDAANSEELPGAVLTVKDSAGETVESWTSGSESHKISLTAGKYTLTEDTAPLGYEKASTISFEVGTDGKIVGQTDNKITMVDELTKYEVEISKVDAANSEELAGATLTIADSNKTIVDTWVSSASETHKVKLVAGTYTLIESITPDGYATAESITFTVGKDGKVTSDATGAVTGTKVTMKDQPKEAEIVITKTIEGEVTKEEAEGSLKFSVKKADGTEIGTYTLKDFDYDSSTGVWTKTIPCVSGGYTVEETVTDITGYTLKSVTYTVDGTSTTGSKADVTVANGGKQTVDFNDSYDVATSEVEISKVDAANSSELPGAKLKITDESGKEVASWTSTTVTHKVTLTAGTYTLTEITAPDGYEKAESITFVVGKDGKVKVGGSEVSKVVMKDQPKQVEPKPGTIQFTKSGLYNETCSDDKDATKVLSGVTFALYSAGDTTNAIATATSDSNGTVTFDKVSDGSYVIKEAATVSGYILDETPYSVTVKDGVATISGITDNTIVNDVPRADIVLKKVAEEDVNIQLPDSTYELYKIDTTGTKVLVAKATTDKDGVLEFNGVLVDTAYSIQEVKASNGSYVSEQPISITFTKSEDGTIKVDSFDAGTDSTTGKSTATIDENGNITWLEPSVRYTFDKVDESGKAVAGATLRIVDKNGSTVDEWVTDGTSHSVDRLLTIGETYTLKEIKAPDGYDLADDITFTVSDGKVSAGEDIVVNIKMVDKLTATTTEVTTTEMTTTETTTEITTTEITTEDTEEETEDTEDTEDTEEETEDTEDTESTTVTTTETTTTTSKKPQTGDQVPVIPIAVVMFLALAGAGGVVIYKKKKEN